MITNQRYADGTSLITENSDCNKKNRRNSRSSIKYRESKAFIFKVLNIKKVLTLAGLQEFKLKDDHIEVVYSFKFLV